LTPKQQFKRADSIIRYQDGLSNYYCSDNAPIRFDDERDILAEMDSISNCIMGAAYKCHYRACHFQTGLAYRLSNSAGRIMKMYKHKCRPRYKLVRVEG
jgi:hypothetical protein